MSTPATLTAASAVARNVAPLVGILLLGWNARNVLYLYFIDTLLAMGVILAGLIRHFQPPVEGEGWAARLNGEVGAIAGALFVVAIFALGLFPNEPLSKIELAAQEYRQLVSTSRLPEGTQ